MARNGASDPSYFEVCKDYQETAQTEVLRKTGKTEHLPYELTRATHALADEFSEKVGSQFETDCKKGCAHCCHQPATIFGFEAIRIAQVLKTSRTPEQLESLTRQMLARVAGFVGGVKKNINNKTACPLLSDGECSVYADRPLTCRMAHSFSVRKCRLSFEGDRHQSQIPISLEIQTGLSGMIEGVFDWLPGENLDGNLYELCSAVLAALANTGVAGEWAGGSASAFAGCIKDDT